MKKNTEKFSVAYHGDTSHFFGIGISRYQIQPVSVFFGRYYRLGVARPFLMLEAFFLTLP